MQNCILIIVLLEVSRLCSCYQLQNYIWKHIYFTYPNIAVTYCPNVYKPKFKLGCNSFKSSTTGLLMYLPNLTVVNQFLRRRDTEGYIIVLPLLLFQDLVSIDSITQDKSVAGILVLASRGLKETFCTSLYKCGYIFSYTSINWPVPVVLMSTNPIYASRLLKCIKEKTGENKCAMEIYFPQYDSPRIEDCYVNKKNKILSYFFPPKKPSCFVATGNNYYVGIYNEKNMTTRKYILLYVRLDTISMFMQGGYCSNEVMPWVFMLIDIGLSFQKAVETVSKYDLLLAFVDLDTPDSLGSFQLLKDISHNHVKFGKKLFGIKNIVFSIKILPLLGKDMKRFFLYRYIVDAYFHKPQPTKDFPFNRIWKKVFEKHNLILLFQQATVSFVSLPPDLLNMFVFTDRLHQDQDIFRDPFLDKKPLDYVRKNLMKMGAVFTDLLSEILNVPGHRVNVSLSLELYHCFVEDFACPFLRHLSTPIEMYYWAVFANPFHCTYVPPIKKTRYPNINARLSNVLRRVLLHVLGTRVSLKECENENKDENTFHTGFAGGQKRCYNIKMVEHSGIFTAGKYDFSDNSSKPLYRYFPNVDGNPAVRLFVVPSSQEEAMLLVVGTILTALSFVGVIFLRHRMNQIMMQVL